MSSNLDQKRRITLPKDVVEELGLAEGSKVAFEVENDKVTLRKLEKKEDVLAKTMSWNPKRRGKPRPVIESEIKEIWS